ncbi:MAG: glutathione binding-like protein [Gammaproteobacteria bacterium]
MKLYYAKGACSLAVRIIINELGLNCDYEAVSLANKTTASGVDFNTINPKGGVVPVLQLDNGEILTENAAIHQYLADNFGGEAVLPPIGDFQRYRVLEWLSFVSSDVHKRYGVLFNAQIPDALKQQIFIPALKKLLAFLDQHLAKSTYLTGDTFTIPDAYLFVVLTWNARAGVNSQEFPALERYSNFLKQRPSIVAALQAEAS